MEKVQRWSAKEKKFVLVDRPHVKLYNTTMGGVYQLDSGVATYRTKVKGKKWWWPHFTNCIHVLLVGTWKVWRTTHPLEKDQTELSLLRFIVSRYLSLPNVRLIDHGSTVTNVNDAVRLNQQFHPLAQGRNQRRCAIPSCKSRPRTVCEVCDVALCVPGDHYTMYHTVKDSINFLNFISPICNILQVCRVTLDDCYLLNSFYHIC